MKKIVFALLVALASLPSWAQTNAASNVNVDAERARLSAERTAIEARYAKERTGCYQKFAVQDCLQDLRRRQRVETDNVKRQESAVNDIDRQRRGAAQLEELDKKNATQDTPAKQEQSREAQKDREQRAADHAQSRAAAASEAADRQRAFESKQRAHADEVAKAAQRAASAPAAQQSYQDKLEKAVEHRADRERRNAERTKPRSAPLPAP